MSLKIGRTGVTGRRRARKEKNLNDSEDSKKYFSLLKWMMQKGYRPSKNLHLHSFADTGRGIMTKEIIQCNDLIIRIPEKLLITPQLALETPQLALETSLKTLFMNHCREAEGEEILSIFLMVEKAKGTASEWYPYIVTLPVTYSNPRFFSQQILSLLPKDVSKICENAIAELRKSYEKLRPLLAVLENTFPTLFSFESYCWAFYTVLTRSVRKRCDECTKNSCSLSLALAPGLDFLNHSSNAQVEAGFNIVTRCYEIWSCEKIKRYDQVFVSYGDHSNHTLLLEYGFVLPNNKHDAIPISKEDILAAYVNINQSPVPTKKLNFLEREKYLLSDLFILPDRLTWCLEVVLKILCSYGSNKDGEDVFVENELFTASNAAEYAMLLHEILSCKIREYGTMSSCEALVGDQDDEHMKLVSTFLSFEKEILQKALLRL